MTWKRIRHFCFAALTLVCASRPTIAQTNDLDIKPDVVYGHKDGMALTYDVIRPKSNANGVGILFMVSGGWVSTWMPAQQMLPMFRPLLDKGYTIIAVRHGSSPRYVVPECVGDVQQALQHVAANADEMKIDAKRLGVFGFSAGGHLTLMLGTVGGKPAASEPAARVAAVVAVFPPTDLAPYVALDSPRREQFPALRFEPARADSVSPLKFVTSDDAPTLLVHGDKDELVPLWHSEKIHEAMDGAKIDNKLVVIEGAGHGFDADGNKRLVDEMGQWFDNHLKPTK